MSIVAARRRPWLVPASIGLVVALVASGALLLLSRHAQTNTATHPFTVAPASEQAPWKVKTVPAGALEKLGKPTKALVTKQGTDVERLVRNVYDAELMTPQALPKVIGNSFTPRAATSFEHARLGVPKGASDVRSTRREARIGIDAAGARSASADVTLAVTGHLEGHKVRLVQRSTLWLQRLEGHWRVVGYDVSQGPAAGHARKGPAHAGAHAGKGGGK